jgi:uncharacterized iron-regulated protein
MTSSLLRLAFPALALTLGAACAPGGPAASAPGPSAVLRVWDTRANRPVSFDELTRAAAASDFVFFGEQHDDPVTHATELALLAAIGERRPQVVLSLEMFERDVQGAVDTYLAGRSPEPEFLAAARPWDRYTTDYRGMVELARARGWPVIASNIPRRLASAVSRGGLAVLDTIPAADKRWIATEHQCPKDDEYYRRFAESMQGHGNGGPSGPALDEASKRMVDRFYEAQCSKDEAMGEAVATAWRAHPGAVVVHYDGAFHSDYRLGTVARALRRSAGARSLVVSAVPVPSLETLPTAEHAAKGDFLVFTLRLPAPSK